MSILLPTRRFLLADGLDADARRYIRAVEAADGQALAPETRRAIDMFVRGCKADGIWSAIKASCIFAGARTLSGAFVPLAGTAPTNFNFVSGDYDRKTGLLGNGSTKYLTSGRNNNADPQDSRHVAVHMTALNTADPGIIIGTSNITGRTAIIRVTNTTARLSSSTAPSGAITAVTGFLGGVRTSSTAVSIRNGGVNTASTVTSDAPGSEIIGVFGSGIGTTLSNPRLAFYSIGESLDLALLDARVTTLINAIAAAIP